MAGAVDEVTLTAGAGGQPIARPALEDEARSAERQGERGRSPHTGRRSRRWTKSGGANSPAPPRRG
ncbi:hypothetical protein GCM10010252_23540 [Streptomyces aureoverticillatus]|nr:hypothetical protein GCM10010252_23540 [Streptomyces aureoverticillatus]